MLLKVIKTVNFQVTEDCLSTIQLHFHGCGGQIQQLPLVHVGLTSSWLQKWI